MGELNSLQPRISKKIPISLEHFFLTVGQNNFGNKIPFFCAREEKGPTTQIKNFYLKKTCRQYLEILKPENIKEHGTM